MAYWGIGMIILGGGAILAAIQNWDWWFKINSTRSQLVHDAFGRYFARLLNAVAGAGLLFVGIADVSGQWPVSPFLNAWLFDDSSFIEEYLPAKEDNSEQARYGVEANPSGLADFQAD